VRPAPPVSSPPALARLDLQPLGRRISVGAGSTVLAAAQSAGAGIIAICGGSGKCGTCRVRLVRGTLTPPTDAEVSVLGAGALADGMRLACQARLAGDAEVDVPAGSVSAPQRLALEGEGVAVVLDPAVEAVDVRLVSPGPGDLRSDAARLLDELADRRHDDVAAALEVLRSLPPRLRNQGWAGRAVVSRPVRGAPELRALLPPGATPLGLAIDLGTTKVAAYLVSLESGEVLGRSGTMNPQIALGEDVLSRIARANSSATSAARLQAGAASSIDSLAVELCGRTRCPPDRIVDAVVVGNTAMHHLLTGLPVRQLGEAPHVPAASAALEVLASELGLQRLGSASCYLPPVIAGFVGADHVAMLLACGMAETRATMLALDIGTNTEISLVHRGRLRSCSTASGPAFEGAHIGEGMRAAPGAIEHVRYLDGRFSVQTIGDLAPIGLCGSGVLDAVAEARRAGALTERGSLARDHRLVSSTPDGPACVLVEGKNAGHGRDIVLRRADVNEIQLAKGAIRAGIDVLLADAGLAAGDLDEVVVAGAFGTYLDLDSAMAIGMLPRLPHGAYRQVGNGAGQGAVQLLLSRRQRVLAQQLAREANYVELTVRRDFADRFVKAMHL
jgi:uncharacterized 2Fe-2S/4Fe-4S cluster protein (DUF4445 family)